MRLDTTPLPRHSVICEFDSKTHKGTYWVAGKILTVATGGGGRRRQAGALQPELLARELLLELVKTGKV